MGVFQQLLCWLTLPPTLGSLAVGCGSPTTTQSPSTSQGQRYLGDPAFRRAELEGSLVNPNNGYSRLRLDRYASGNSADWDRLPEWNPPVEPVASAELDAPGGVDPTSLSPNAVPLALPERVASVDDRSLLQLGRAAFRAYPVQLAPYWSVALSSRDRATQYGLWIDEARGVGGLVRARRADGKGAVMVTCSTCHAAPGEGGIVDGLPNAALNVGAAILASAGDPGAPVASPIAAWGPGRLDVSTQAGTEPARIPDLRPVRWLTYLQQDATVRARDLVALTIRIETLIITSHNETTRPPRVIALALTAYLLSLGDAFTSLQAAGAASSGAQVFATHCAACHADQGLTGDPVALSVVGTDPTLGESADRGTGTYRVPSLRGVATRGPLLHNGTIPSVDALFDPARVTGAFAGRLHGAGSVQGHPFGLDLTDADRARLLDYLHRL